MAMGGVCLSVTADSRFRFNGNEQGGVTTVRGTFYSSDGGHL